MALMTPVARPALREPPPPWPFYSFLAIDPISDASRTLVNVISMRASLSLIYP